MKREDITGRKFGRLTAIRYAGKSKGKQTLWECKCDCGKNVIVHHQNLKSGHTSSCGCFNLESTIKRSSTHGGSKTRLYTIWHDMLNRCYKENHRCYKDYGGKGVFVCDEWKNDKESFCLWALSHGYKPGLSIDRIDNDKNYCPDNCRWVTMHQQSLNTSKNVKITYDGKTQTLKEWANELGIKNTTLHNRIHYYGWSIEKAFTTPVRPY